MRHRPGGGSYVYTRQSRGKCAKRHFFMGNLALQLGGACAVCIGSFRDDAPRCIVMSGHAEKDLVQQASAGATGRVGGHAFGPVLNRDAATASGNASAAGRFACTSSSASAGEFLAGVFGSPGFRVSGFRGFRVCGFAGFRLRFRRSFRRRLQPQFQLRLLPHWPLYCRFCLCRLRQ